MKSILEVIILLLLSFLIGSNKSVDTACSLPDTSQWSVANSDICLKVNGDSIFWTMKSDKKDIPAITASARYNLLTSGRISLTYSLPLLSQDLSYIYGERNEILHPYVSRKMINWYFIHLRVILLFFVVKTKMETEDMQTMNSTTNQLLTETYTSLCPIIIHYINRKINDYESARDMAQDVFLRLMEYKQMLRKETVRSMAFFIAHNLVVDYLRRYYRKQEMSAYFYEYGMNVTDDTESGVIANDLSAQENLKLLQLSPQRRTVYIMSRFQGKTEPEISEELCLSRRTIENHLLASRKKIREYIKSCI